MHVFQTEFPKAAAKRIGLAIVARKLTPELIQDAWVVAEYGLWLATPDRLIGDGPAAEPTEAQEIEAGRLLAEAADEPDALELAALPPLPWPVIVRAILKLVLTVLL